MKIVLLLLLFLISLSTYAQKISQEDLYQTWYLDKYSDEEQYYLPPKKEMTDYITLNTDMTYQLVSEGEPETGSWLFNANGEYVELKSKKGRKEKFYIYFLSSKSMVVTYDTDEYRIWEVHYISSK
ncbi:MAG: lipocalin family protein [Thermonemataceae bacterium]